MKKQWERSTPRVVLGHAQLKRMLHAIFPGRELRTAHQIQGGLSNTIYRVVIGGHSGPDEALAVRVYTRDPTGYTLDCDVASRLKGIVPVPQVLHVDETRSHCEHPFAVLSWLDGDLLDDVATHEPRTDFLGALSACGHMLARLQQVTFPQPGFFGPGLNVTHPLPSGKHAYMDWMRETLANPLAVDRLGATLYRRLLGVLNDRADLVDLVRDDCALVHGDFNGSNVMLKGKDGAWEVSGILDWEFAFSGSGLFDVGNMLRHLEKWDREVQDTFTGAYQDEGGRWPPKALEIAALLDLMSLGQLVTMPTVGPRMGKDLLRVISAAVDRLSPSP